MNANRSFAASCTCCMYLEGETPTPTAVALRGVGVGRLCLVGKICFLVCVQFSCRFVTFGGSKP